MSIDSSNSSSSSSSDDNMNDNICFIDEQGNEHTMKEIKHELRRKLKENKPKFIIRFGYRWLSRTDIRKHKLQSLVPFQLITDKKQLKHINSLIHRDYTLFELEGGSFDFDKEMNILTDNNFGSLNDYETTKTTELIHYEHCRILYRVHLLTNKGTGKYNFIIADTYENEQPDITDTFPTPNPNWLMIGVIANEHDVISLNQSN